MIRLFILRSISRNLIPPRPAESLVPPGALLVARIAWLHLKFLTPLPAGLCVYPVSSPMNGERTVNRVKKARKELCLSMYIFHPRILNIPSTIDSYCPPLGGILTLQPRRAELIIFFRCSYLFIDAPICREQQNNTSNEKITRLSVCKSISERRERVSSSVNALSIRAIKFSLLLPWSRPGLSRFIFPLLIGNAANRRRDASAKNGPLGFTSDRMRCIGSGRNTSPLSQEIATSEDLQRNYNRLPSASERPLSSPLVTAAGSLATIRLDGYTGTCAKDTGSKGGRRGMAVAVARNE